MQFLRSRVIVTLFFSLITVGQAYPYSHAWAIGQEPRCGCNLSGRKCIHGCDLKKKGHMHRHDSHHSSSQERHGGKGKVRGCHETQEDNAPGWVSPQCSRQQQRQMLSFQSDPFLPVFVSWPDTVFISYPTGDFASGLRGASLAPEPPPPRA